MEWLVIIFFVVIFFVFGIFGKPINQKQDEYLSGEDGNDNY